MLAFRNLADPGGPGFTAAQVEAMAADYKVKDIDDQGELIERAGRPADHFPAPFANELAAKATQWRARRPTCRCWPRRAATSAASPGSSSTSFTQYQEQGPDYIAALLKGYEDAAEGLRRCRRAATTTNISRATPSPCRSRCRTGQVTYRRRHAADAGSVFQGRRGLPDVGGRAAHGRRASASASRS